jgi:hypothetical protein
MPKKTINNNNNSPAFNVTEVLLVANSNIRFNLKANYLNFVKEITELKNLILEDPDSADFIFGKAPEVDTVESKAFGVEIGKKQKRGHFNWVVEIKHSVPKYSVYKLAARLKQFLDLNYTASKGWNVHATLQDKRLTNYANKEDRWAKNDSIEETEELLRLSDPRQLITTNSLNKEFRKLEV